MYFFIGIIKVIIILGFLIFIHEGGHFFVARICKVKVKEFSIGFGHKIWSKKGKDNTTYSIRLLPLGGYVDMDEENYSNDENTFRNTKIWKRILIVVSGAIINIIFGILLYFVLILILNRDLIYSIKNTIYFLKDICNSFIGLFKGNISVNEMSGPIGISNYIINTINISDLVYLISLISILLGLTNLLPIPALDGGKIVLLIIEAFRRKPIKEELEIKIQFYGFLFLMGLALYVSCNDIIKII